MDPVAVSGKTPKKVDNKVHSQHLLFVVCYVTFRAAYSLAVTFTVLLLLIRFVNRSELWLQTHARDMHLINSKLILMTRKFGPVVFRTLFMRPLESSLTYKNNVPCLREWGGLARP